MLDDDQTGRAARSARSTTTTATGACARLLAAQYNLGNREPNIQVWNVDVRGDRSLTLRHQQHDRRPLGESTEEVLKHLHRLWGFDVHLDTVRGDKVLQSQHVPPHSGGAEGEDDYPHLDLALPAI